MLNHLLQVKNKGGCRFRLYIKRHFQGQKRKKLKKSNVKPNFFYFLKII